MSNEPDDTPMSRDEIVETAGGEEAYQALLKFSDAVVSCVKGRGKAKAKVFQDYKGQVFY